MIDDAYDMVGLAVVRMGMYKWTLRFNEHAAGGFI